MRDSAKSGLFLIEMIIAILFFSVSAAISANLFVRAYLISENTRETNLAVIKAQSVAESFKAMDGSLPETANMFRGQSNDKGFSVYYDKKWNYADPDLAIYRVDVASLPDAALRSIEITVIDVRRDSAAPPLFTLEAKKYAP